VENLEECGVFKMKKVLTFMVGDLFHIGHLNMLEKASQLGDYLIIGIPTSWTIKEHIKGKTPIFSAEERLRIVQSLKMVNFAFIYTDTDSLNESIRLLQPDVICRGDDNKNFFGKTVAEEVGCEIVYFPYTKGISSTEIRRRLCE
jgi:cytidyltransferase-like protein